MPFSCLFVVIITRRATIAEFTLMQRMLNFVQGLQYYMSYEVLEKNWLLMQRTLCEAATIDEVLARHTGELKDVRTPAAEQVCVNIIRLLTSKAAVRKQFLKRSRPFKLYFSLLVAALEDGTKCITPFPLQETLLARQTLFAAVLCTLNAQMLACVLDIRVQGWLVFTSMRGHGV